MKKGIVFIILVILSTVSLMSLISDHADEVDSETNGDVEGWFDKSGKSLESSSGSVGCWKYISSSGTLCVRMNTLDKTSQPSFSYSGGIPLPWSVGYDKLDVKTIYLENWTTVWMFDYGTKAKSAFPNLESFYAFSSGTSVCGYGSYVNSISSVTYRSFEGCSKLTTVAINTESEKNGFVVINGPSAGRISIDSAFNNSGVTNVELNNVNLSNPNGGCPFENCSKLKSVTITGSSFIGMTSFNNCTSLNTVSIGEGVETIGTGAFANCAITEITLPATFKTIDASSSYISWFNNYGYNIFYNCKSLKTININSGNTAFSIVNGALVRNDGNLLVSYPCAAEATSFNTGTIESIARHAINNPSNLKTINSSKEGVFNLTGLTLTNYSIEGTNPSKLEIDADNLKYASTIVDSNTLVEIYDFTLTKEYVAQIGLDPGSKVKQNLVIKSTSSNIVGEGCFENFTSLESIILPSNVSGAMEGAFRGCTSLRVVGFQGNVTIIGDYAFDGCTSLSQVGTIPNTYNLPYVSQIGKGSFQYCKGEGSIALVLSDTFDNVNVGDYAFLNSGVSKVKRLDPSTTGADGRTTIILGIGSFSGSSIVSFESLELKNLPQEVFKGCVHLESVVLESGCNGVGTSSFEGCVSLSGIYCTDNSIQTIGSKAFSGCTNLLEIGSSNGVVKLSSVKSIGSDSFKNCKSISDVYLPECSSVEVNAFEGCRSLKEIDLKNSSLHGDSISDLTILTAIPNYAFSGTLIEKVLLSTTLTSMGDRSFSNCTALESISMGLTDSKGLHVLGNVNFGSFCFSGATYLSLASLDKTTSVPEGLFQNCTLLSAVIFSEPNDSRSIGKQAFMGCSNLKTVTDCNGIGLQMDLLSSIGEGAFYNCTSLDSGVEGVLIGTKIDTIPSESFYGCAFKKFVIPNSVKTIGTNAIYSGSLMSISIPSSVDYIGTGAIKGSNGCIVYVNRTADFSGYNDGFIASGSVVHCTEGASLQVTTKVSDCDIVMDEACRVSFGTSDSSPTDYLGIQNVLRGSDIVAPHSPSTGIYALEGKLKTGGGEGSVIKIYGHSTFILKDEGAVSDSYNVVFKSETQGLHIYGENEGAVSVTVKYGVSTTIPNVYADTTSTKNPGNFKSSASDTVLVPGQNGVYITELSDYILQGVDKPYTLTLDFGDYTKTYEYAAGTKITLPVQSKTGYQWEGWYYGDVKVDNDYEMPAGNVTLVSKFTLNPSSVKITYVKWDGSTIVKELSPKGVYSITIDSLGLLTCSYNSDGPKTEQFVARDVIEAGRDYNGFYKEGVPFTGGDRLSGNLQLKVETKDIVYRVTYDFGGVSNVLFKGNTVSSSCNETYTYTEVVNGLEVPFPLHSTLVCTEARIGSQSWSGSFNLGVNELGSSTSITIYFTFQSGYYSVQFVYNDDSGRIWSAGSVNDSGSITTPSPVSGSKKWYTFSYWYIDGKSDKKYDPATTYPVSEVKPTSGNSIVFKAYWDPITIKVSFDIDGGSIPRPDTTVSTDSSLDLSYGGVKAGYEFKGWMIDDYLISASSCVISQDFLTAHCKDGKIQFKAIWGAVGYSIRFDLNGADSPHDYNSFNADNKVVGSSISIPSGSDAVRAFYTFQYWSLGNVPYETTEFDLTADMVRYAVESDGKYVLTFIMEWTSKSSYTVTYDVNGGSGYPPSDSNRYSVGSSITLASTAENMYRDGYQFGGWALDPESYDVFQTQTFTNQMAVMAEKTNDNLKLYAVWNQQQYKVDYDLDGGFVSSDLRTDIKYGNKFSIPTPFKTGYQFKGWVSNDLTTSARVVIDGNPSIWLNGETAIADSYLNLTSTPNATVKLKAVWTESEYIVSYNLNGGEGTLSGGDTRGVLNKPFTFPTLSGASKPGYTFSGWSLDKMTVLTTNVFTPEMADAADSNSSVMIYAVWTPVEYTIQFRYSETDTYQTTGAFFNTPIQIETPENIGYKFVGWKSDDIKAGAMYSRDGVIWYSWVNKSDVANGSYFMNLTSQTDGKGIVHLTAVWEKIGYKIVYSANGGTGDVPVDDKIYHVGDKIELASTDSLVGTNGNKIILGWALESTSTVPLSIDEFVEGLAEKANIANQVTFYAVWIEGSYKVTVDVGESKPSMIPGGWEQTGDSKYTRSVEYGTMTKDVLADWDNVVLDLEGFVFTGWSYDIASVVTNIDVSAEFEEVSKDIMYYFIGAVSVIGVVAFAFTRFERW